MRAPWPERRVVLAFVAILLVLSHAPTVQAASPSPSSDTTSLDSLLSGLEGIQAYILELANSGTDTNTFLENALKVTKFVTVLSKWEEWKELLGNITTTAASATDSSWKEILKDKAVVLISASLLSSKINVTAYWEALTEGLTAIKNFGDDDTDATTTILSVDEGTATTTTTDTSSGASSNETDEEWYEKIQALLANFGIESSWKGLKYIQGIGSVLDSLGASIEQSPLKNKLSNAVSNSLAGIETAMSTMVATVDEIEDTMCDEGTYVAPPTLKPTCTGSTSILNFQGGFCSFRHDGTVLCKPPQVRVIKKPAVCMLKSTKKGLVSGKTCAISKDFGEEKTGALAPSLDAKTYNLTELYDESDLTDALKDYDTAVGEDMSELADKAVEAFRDWWTSKYGHFSLSDIPTISEIKTLATTIVANAVEKLKPYFVLTVGGEGSL